ncbi:GMC oxidoreductase [Salicibibacter kimchii]|uniref:GMC oxidoreductase n=1 Tax=Salicibibacter kimchii TaxID=2099786 RepID=UPI003001186C
MERYRRSLSIFIVTDDDVKYRNRVELDTHTKDEHGPVASIHFSPSKGEQERTTQLAKIAADILRKAGARDIHRNALSDNFYIHPKSTMQMGKVIDDACEAYQVNRLFIADNSVHAASIGGMNPTLTTQAIATRTAKLLVEKYF